MSLRITEIFYSIQGESTTSGLPTVFVRLTGCPLRCQYCDTAYAFHGGEIYSLERVLEEVAGWSPAYVTVTGGEPLAQPDCLFLLSALCDKGYRVSLETSGAIDIGSVDPRVVRVMDWKTPGSKEVDRNLPGNMNCLLPQDQVKFVICNREDYDWAKSVIRQYALHERVSDILFSPSNNELPDRNLAEWILADKLNVRFQIQLHKVLWGDTPGH